MQVRISGLTSIKGVYYYRKRVPAKYQSHVGTQTIKCSLRTKDLNKAELACKFLSSQVNKLFNSGNACMIDKKTIDKKIAEYVDESLYESERHMASYGRVCQATRDEEKKRFEFTKQGLIE